MPITVVVGGQYGSEGKGKIAHYLASARNAAAVVRVGGPNSGHTVVTTDGLVHKFRHLPTAAVLPQTKCVLAAGSYIDVDRLLLEIKTTRLSSDRLIIDPEASIVTQDHMRAESGSHLRARIGSTLSGTGAAVLHRVSRAGNVRLAKHEPQLAPYLGCVRELLCDLLGEGQRIVIEGTQGYGLSLYHGVEYPYATSRDTTASGCLSEVGLSPLDVDEVALVIRTFPIRVSGSSGPLPEEIDWETVTRLSGSPKPIVEYTTVTKLQRRVARFHPDVVRSAIGANRPTLLFMNHIDYIDWTVRGEGVLSNKIWDFICDVESMIGCRISAVGFSRNSTKEIG